MAETVEESYETVTRKVVRKSIKIEEVSPNRNVIHSCLRHVPLVSSSAGISSYVNIITPLRISNCKIFSVRHSFFVTNPAKIEALFALSTDALHFETSPQTFKSAPEKWLYMSRSEFQALAIKLGAFGS